MDEVQRLTQPLTIGLVLGTTALSLVIAGVLRDRGVPPPTTRWVASVLGGVAYLVAVLWLDVRIALVLSTLSLLLIVGLRARRTRLLRGLRWSPQAESRAELGYCAVATLALAAAWTARHDPRLALLAILCMAWGDASAGLVRGSGPGSLPRNLAASAVMLGVCLASAWLVYPSAAAFAAGVVATAAEAVWPLSRSRLSDSWPVVGSAVCVIFLLGGAV